MQIHMLMQSVSQLRDGTKIPLGFLSEFTQVLIETPHTTHLHEVELTIIFTFKFKDEGDGAVHFKIIRLHETRRDGEDEDQVSFPRVHVGRAHLVPHNLPALRCIISQATVKQVCRDSKVGISQI